MEGLGFSPDAMKIQLNGQSRDVLATTVAALLKEIHLLPSQVAVEHNGTVLFRHELDHAKLQADDKLEIIRVVAGG